MPDGTPARSGRGGPARAGRSSAPVPGRARTGSGDDHEIGTIAFLPWGRMDALYAAVVQSVEEAVLNALVVNAEMVGRDGHRSPRLPLDRLSELLAEAP